MYWTAVITLSTAYRVEYRLGIAALRVTPRSVWPPWPSQTLPLGRWWSSDDHCQPRQREETSRKDILVIRRSSRIVPAMRELLRSDW